MKIYDVKVELEARNDLYKGAADYAAEAKVLKQWITLDQQQSEPKSQIKTADAKLDQLAHDQYAKLSINEIKTLVVDDKWLAAITTAVQGELDRVSQTLTSRIRQLAERYATPLPTLLDEVSALSARVDKHLEKMGFAL